MTAAVTLENLTLSYDRHPAVHHLSGEFATGSLTAVTGPNGAGKSTLLKGIAGIVAPEEGRISTTGTLAYLPQAVELQRDFPLTILQMVTTGFWNQSGSFKAITRTQKAKAVEALHMVGLAGLEHRQLSGLSAGQFQRALFARLLLQDASLILLDEPFAAIDTNTMAKLLEIIQVWHKEGRTVICVLHDFEQIRQHFPQCLLLARKCIAWGDSHDTLQPERLMNASFFHQAWPQQPKMCSQ
jgi:zinc/manganese transport system ATP-binding protein